MIGIRSTAVSTLQCAIAATIATCAHGTESHPSHTVRVIVPSAPGGSVDAPGRLVAQTLSTSMGQQFVVENRSGANSGGHLATEMFACTGGVKPTHIPHRRPRST